LGGVALGMAQSKTSQLFKASWAVLEEEHQLLLFPILSLFLMASFLALGIGGLYAIGTFNRVDIEFRHLTVWGLVSGEAPGFGIVDLVGVLALYVLLTAVALYFNSAMCAAVWERTQGRPASIRNGIRLATRRLPIIVAWACFASTAGLLLECLRSSNNPLLKLLGLALGIAWSFMTFLVVPVLVVEGTTPVGALRRSTQLLESTWGKQLTVRVGLGLAYIPVIVIGFIPLCLALAGAPLVEVALLAIVTTPFALAGLALLGALDGIFTVALYAYAANGVVSGDFARELVQQAFKSRRQGAR
jgi:hypothetical protein